MKFLNYKVLLISTFTFFVIGCSKDFIEKSPYDSIPSNQALNSADALQNALNGAYASLRTSDLFGRDFPVIGDLQADNTFVETKNSGRYLSQYNYSVTVTDGVAEEMWDDAYTGILRANQIINAVVTGDAADQIKAQALGIRALLYFKLVNIYAKPYTDTKDGLGVPIALTYSPYNLPSRNTISEVYTQIVNDLTTAFAKAPDYTSSVGLSKYAIEGLLAKVYLYEGDNAKALQAAADVINNSGFTLVTPSNYDAYWSDPAQRTDQVETLFEVDADVINNNGFDDIGAIYINGYQDIYASMQLYNLYSPTDVRKTLLIEDKTKSGAAAILVNKFPNAQNADRDNLKVMRLSEVYLIAAEAAVSTNEGTARTYLNALLKQRDPDFAGYTSTGQTLLNDIITERRKELAFEGDRLYDLNRLKRTIVRQQNAGAIPAGEGNANLTIPYPDNRRVAPIPQNEIQANPNIAKQQNPGY